MDRDIDEAVKEKNRKFLTGEVLQNVNSLSQENSGTSKIGQQTISGTKQSSEIMTQKSSKQNINILAERNCPVIEIEKCDSEFYHCMKAVISRRSYFNVNTEEIKENLSPNVSSHKKCIQNLCLEAAKMKGYKTMSLVPSGSLLQLFSILKENINKGMDMLTPSNVIKCSVKTNMAKNELTTLADSALTMLYILTSPDIPNTIYSEDVLEQIVAFLKYLIEIFHTSGFETEIWETKNDEYKILQEANLYDKLEKMLILFLELIGGVLLPESIARSIISLTIQACYWCTPTTFSQILFKLHGKIFSKYEILKMEMLDKILATNVSIYTCRKNIPKYELLSGEYIQRSSALVLHVMHCDLSVHEFRRHCSESNEGIYPGVSKLLDKVTDTSTYFFSTLIDVCAENANGCLGVIEEFVRDLLMLTSKPEWPVVEIMLNTLGALLLSKLPVAIGTAYRTLAVYILGLIVISLNRNATKLQITSEIEKSIQTLLPNDKLNVEGNRKYVFQKVLLGYFSTHAKEDQARLLHLAVWYRDEVNISSTTHSKNDGCSVPSDGKQKCVMSSKEKDLLQVTVDWRQFLASQIKAETLNQDFNVNYKHLECICWALSLSRSYSCSISSYVSHIVSLLTDVSIVVRTKAIKCIVQISEADVSILQGKELLSAIEVCFHDQSSYVRESTVELVGKLMMCYPEMPEFYDLLMARIVDSNISVRKQVLRTLKSICSHYLNPTKVPDVCFKMIKRMNDDESVKKLVVEVFQDMWFTPTDMKSSLFFRTRILASVVGMSDSLSLSCLRKLFHSIKALQLKKATRSELTVPERGCEQLIAIFVEIIKDSSTGKQYLLQCITALQLLSQVWPQMLVIHSGVLRAFLCQQYHVPENYQVISNVAQIFAHVVPFLKTPNDFLVQLEADIENLVMCHNSMVIENCMLCLASIYNITKNPEVVHKYFNRYFTFLSKNFDCTVNEPMSPRVTKCHMFLQTALCIIGLLLKHFDFTDNSINACMSKENKTKMFEILLHFLQQNDLVMQKYALKAVGSFCIQNRDLLMQMELKKCYKDFLKDARTHVGIRAQILKNVETYLISEETNWSKDNICMHPAVPKQGSLKVIGDTLSGLATCVIQSVLPEILNSFLCFDCGVRSTVFNIVHLALRQGLVYRPQVLSHVIAMTTDVDNYVRCGAESLLKDAEKHIGALQSKFQSGIYLSFSLQKILQNQETVGIIRGFLIKEDVPIAMNNFMYLLVRPLKQYRNTFLSVLVKNFDSTANKCLSQMLYLADNLAHFSYSTQDEVLFLLNNITVVLSVFCSSLLVIFNEKVKSDQRRTVNVPVDGCDEGIALHLTEKTEVIQEFVDASQGCILLLLLKEHLQKMYGINDEKLLQYTASASIKGRERVVNKRGNFCFEPSPVIEKLRHPDMQNSSQDDLKQQVMYIEQVILRCEHGVGRDSEISAVGTNYDDVVGATHSLATELNNTVQSPAAVSGQDISRKSRRLQRKEDFQHDIVCSEEECVCKKRKVGKEKHLQ